VFNLHQLENSNNKINNKEKVHNAHNAHNHIKDLFNHYKVKIEDNQKLM